MIVNPFTNYIGAKRPVGTGLWGTGSNFRRKGGWPFFFCGGEVVFFVQGQGFSFTMVLL